MSCAECKQRCFPQNPTVGQYHRGRWLKPICECCPEYVEPVEDVETLVPYHDTRSERKSGVDLRDEFAILKGKVNFLMREREGKRVTKKAKGSIPL